MANASGVNNAVGVVKTKAQLRRDVVVARNKANPGLTARNRATNVLARDRYGIARQTTTEGEGLGTLANAAERDKVLANANDRLRIKPDAVNRARKIDATSKTISKGFQSLSAFRGSVTDSIDNTQARGIVARLRDQLEEAGSTQLVDQLNEYLIRFPRNREIGGQGLGDALNTLGLIENSIRDVYDVDFIFEEGTDGQPLGAALGSREQINPRTGRKWEFQTVQDVRESKLKKRLRDRKFEAGFDGAPGEVFVRGAGAESRTATTNRRARNDTYDNTPVGGINSAFGNLNAPNRRPLQAKKFNPYTGEPL